MISLNERTQGGVVGVGKEGVGAQRPGGTCAGGAGAGSPFKESGRATHDSFLELQLNRGATTREIAHVSKTYVI